MPKITEHSGDKNNASAPRRHWLTGMVAGQCLGLVVAVIAAASVPALLVTVLVGGVVGGMTGARQKTKTTQAPVRNKRVQTAFRALEIVSKKISEIVHINEEFNGASSGEKDRRSMKKEAKLTLKPPAPPKPTGM